MSKTQKSFSLAELVVVLSIIILLVLVSIPNIVKYYKKYKFNDYAFQIEASLNWAKLKAIELSNNILICVQGNSLIIKNVGLERTRNCNQGIEISRITIDENWISLDQTTNPLLWDARGISVFSGHICITDGENYYIMYYQTNRSLIRTEGGVGTCP